MLASSPTRIWTSSKPKASPACSSGIDPDKLDDAAIAAIKDKIQRSGLYVPPWRWTAITSIPTRPSARRQNTYTIK